MHVCGMLLYTDENKTTLSYLKDAHIEFYLEHLGKESCKSLLAGSPDFVLLCHRDVDSLTTAISWCTERHIRVLPCLSGAASSEGTCEVVHQMLSMLHEVFTHQTCQTFKNSAVVSESSQL